MRVTVLALVTTGALSIAGGLSYLWLTRTQVHKPGEDVPEITSKLSRDRPGEAPEARFTDVTKEAGLGSFLTFQGPRSSQLPEDMGSGAAWGDFDNDGDDDLFLVAAGGPLNRDSADWAPSLLFENQAGNFVAVDVFPDIRIIGMAAAWGDYNGDGWLDLVVTGYNRLLLFRNEQGRMVPDTSFPEHRGFWAGAAWGDFNNDRLLDLYVCGYVRYLENTASASVSKQFGRAVPFTLNPSSYQPERNLLFLNLGNGRFREVAEQMGVSNPQGRSLAAVWHDFDQDGWLDLYVANDVSDNALFQNNGTGFTDASHSAWVADYRGAMGLAVGDYNRDGDDDIFVTHWIAQENALYDSLHVDLRAKPKKKSENTTANQNPGSKDAASGLRFMDLASVLGLGQPALNMVGWGTEFADFDGDGWLDLVVANGSTFETDDVPPRLKPQNPFLFWSRKGEHFFDLAPTSPVLNSPHVNRGVALSDYDRDGDVDILLVQHDEGVQLLRNDMQKGNWLQVRLRSLTRPDSQHVGAGEGAVLTATIGDVPLRRSVGGASYLSQSSRTIHFGLGPATEIDRLEVKWHGGELDLYENLKANTVWEIREKDPVPRKLSLSGSGSAKETPPGEAEKRRAEKKSREDIAAFWAKQRAAVNAMKVDGDLRGAADLFREALALNPEHEDARYYLSNCLAGLGETEAAIAELRKLVRINPRSHRALKRLALLLTKSAKTEKDLREAMDFLEMALNVNREETGVLLAMGEIALILGDEEKADQQLEWACRTNPRAVSGFFVRGYIAWRRGDVVAAKRLLSKAAEARGDEWKPEGATAEGDVRKLMHRESSPLEQFWRKWQGSLDPEQAYASLDSHLKLHQLNGQ